MHCLGSHCILGVKSKLGDCGVDGGGGRFTRTELRARSGSWPLGDRDVFGLGDSGRWREFEDGQCGGEVVVVVGV